MFELQRKSSVFQILSISLTDKTKFQNDKERFRPNGPNLFNLKSASNLNGNLNCSKELEHYAS